MNDSKIAVRYAKALFMSSEEKKMIQEVRKDMKYLLELCKLDDFRILLDSPVIENSIKQNAMTALLGSNIGKLSLSMVKLTVDNNREAFLPGIARGFIDIADRAAGITKVNLTTATEVSKVNNEKIVGIIEKQMETNADLEENIDNEIIGGFILKVDDMYVDASVKTQLRTINKELLETT